MNIDGNYSSFETVTISLKRYDVMRKKICDLQFKLNEVENKYFEILDILGFDTLTFKEIDPSTIIRQTDTINNRFIIEIPFPKKLDLIFNKED